MTLYVNYDYKVLWIMKRTIKKSRYVLLRPMVLYNDRIRLREKLDVSDLTFSLLAYVTLTTDKWHTFNEDLQKVANELGKTVTMEYYPEDKNKTVIEYKPIISAVDTRHDPKLGVRDTLLNIETLTDYSSSSIKSIYSIVTLKKDLHFRFDDFNIMSEGDNIFVFRVRDNKRVNVKTYHNYKEMDSTELYRSLFMDTISYSIPLIKFPEGM